MPDLGKKAENYQVLTIQTLKSLWKTFHPDNFIIEPEKARILGFCRMIPSIFFIIHRSMLKVTNENDGRRPPVSVKKASHPGC